jgi:RNA polymerase sigma-70 factor (ECF subfamily)
MIAELAVTLDAHTPDLELARYVAGGDERAFRFLMRRYNQMLYRTARGILRDDAEAEDALQESYLQALRAIKDFRGDAKLSTWLVRLVVNNSIARLRKTRRSAQVISLEGDVDLQLLLETNMTDDGEAQPEREALRAEARRIIERKIDELPDAFRTVFMLRAVEEMSVEETAASLGIPEATVRSRLFRARGLLRASLSQEMDIAIGSAFSFDGERCDRIVEGVIARMHEIHPRVT